MDWYFVTKGAYMASDPDRFRDYFEDNLSGKTFLDLGCGRGGIVQAAEDAGATASGIEWEQEFVDEAPESCTQGDFFDADFNDYDYLFYYLKGSDDEDTLKTRLNAFSGTLIIDTFFVDQVSVAEFKDGLTCNYVEF